MLLLFIIYYYYFMALNPHFKTLIFLALFFSSASCLGNVRVQSHNRKKTHRTTTFCYGVPCTPSPIPKRIDYDALGGPICDRPSSSSLSSVFGPCARTLYKWFCFGKHTQKTADDTANTTRHLCDGVDTARRNKQPSAVAEHTHTKTASAFPNSITPQTETHTHRDMLCYNTHGSTYTVTFKSYKLESAVSTVHVLCAVHR